MLRRPAFKIIHPTVVSAVKGTGLKKDIHKESSPSLKRAVASIELALHHGHDINLRLSRAIYYRNAPQRATDTRKFQRENWGGRATLLERRVALLGPVLDDQTAALLAAVEDVATHLRVLAVLKSFDGSMGVFGAPRDRDATTHWDIVAGEVGVDVRPFDSPLALRRLGRIRELVGELREEVRLLAEEEELKALVVASSAVLCRDHRAAWRKKVQEGVDGASDVSRDRRMEGSAVYRRMAGSALYRTLLSLNSSGAMDEDEAVAVEEGGSQEPELVSLGFFQNREISVLYEKRNREAIMRAQQRVS